MTDIHALPITKDDPAGKEEKQLLAQFEALPSEELQQQMVEYLLMQPWGQYPPISLSRYSHFSTQHGKVAS